MRAPLAFIDGAFVPADIGIVEGIIAAIDSGCTARGRHTRRRRGARAGLVDSHVHVNEPGRTEWEGFATATRGRRGGRRDDDRRHAAQQHPRTTTSRALEAKRAAAARPVPSTWASGAERAREPRPTRGAADAGVFGFKCFLSPSGVDEFPHLDAEQLAARSARSPRSTGCCIVHAEDPAVIDAHATRPASLRRLPRVAAACGRDRGDRAVIAPAAAHRRPRPHRAPLVAPRRSRAAAARAEGVPITSRPARTT